jgi:hypothetical protein
MRSFESPSFNHVNYNTSIEASRYGIISSHFLFFGYKYFPELEYTITVTNNRGLEIKMNRFNQMCSTIRRALINRTRKETQIKCYEILGRTGRLLSFDTTRIAYKTKELERGTQTHRQQRDLISLLSIFSLLSLF